MFENGIALLFFVLGSSLKRAASSNHVVWRKLDLWDLPSGRLEGENHPETIRQSSKSPYKVIHTKTTPIETGKTNTNKPKAAPSPSFKVYLFVFFLVSSNKKKHLNQTSLRSVPSLLHLKTTTDQPEGLLQQGINLLDGGVLLTGESQIHHRHVGRGHTSLRGLKRARFFGDFFSGSWVFVGFLHGCFDGFDMF